MEREKEMDRKQWRNQVVEAAIEPDLPIIDTHHHLWTPSPFPRWETYGPVELRDDIANCGHNIIGTVYTDSHYNYRTDGPEDLRLVGETEYAEQVRQEGRRIGGTAAGICAAIVSTADLLQGEKVGEVLDAHVTASPRFRGIRQITAFDGNLEPVYGATEAGLMTRPAFREGFAELVRRDLTFDAYLFFSQLPELVDLAQEFPEARIVLNHLGGYIGISTYAERPEETFAQWKANMATVAALPNVSLKLGGVNMAVTAMVPADDERPFTSEQIASAQRHLFLTAIDLFGPDRCMVESNFPVDMHYVSYTVLWNAFKRMTADFSDEERSNLFSETAKRNYRFEI
jgi:predicted TIM-barrel fold metal-dependent hydrolase